MEANAALFNYPVASIERRKELRRLRRQVASDISINGFALLPESVRLFENAMTSEQELSEIQAEVAKITQTSAITS
ncbi:hypothetical protein CCAX7_008700 [Capsulimonas corticalis]|uniref:Uncharacterized protein n=1 Tax=Capsulimonas corticalis TaxID=2219043 RepID=A0A402CU10_9BACT|nr:hypothetical protein [Capsulimonas corticalis]BDI28819.1 hypothetical protein CCAX7_008700 [Capsulimonas corticalis]